MINVSKYGHAECVKLLIPLSNCKVSDSLALSCAAINGHTEIVRLLIPHSDCKSNDSQALILAAEHGYIDIVKMLIPHSDIDSAINQLKNNTPYCQENVDKSLEFISDYLNKKQRYLLLKKINKERNQAINKSKRKI